MKLLPAIFLLIVTHAFGDASHFDAELEALGSLPYESRVDLIQKMSSEHRKDLIEAIKQRPIPEYQGSHFADLLLHLGDEETIQKEADIMIQHDDLLAFYGLQTCRNPRVIAAMCPIFLKDDNGSNLVFAASNAMFLMIPNTPGFRPEVYDWIASVHENAYPLASKIFREWWKANEAAFKKGAFKAVKPGNLSIADPADDYKPVVKEPPNAPQSAPNEREQRTKAKNPTEGHVRYGIGYVALVMLFMMIAAGAFIFARRSK